MEPGPGARDQGGKQRKGEVNKAHHQKKKFLK
jgi:hypothetical protein